MDVNTTRIVASARVFRAPSARFGSEMAGGVQHVTSSNRCNEQGSNASKRKNAQGKSSDSWLMAET